MALWCNGDPFLVEHVLRMPSHSDGKYLRSGAWMDMVDQLACLVSMAAWTTNKNRTGARLSPCLTPDIELKINSTSSTLILILIFVYIVLIVAIVFSGIPYFFSIFHSMNAFTISTNRMNES